MTNLSCGYVFVLFGVGHLMFWFHADIRWVIDLISFLFDDIRSLVGLFIFEILLFLFRIVVLEGLILCFLSFVGIQACDRLIGEAIFRKLVCFDEGLLCHLLFGGGARLVDEVAVFNGLLFSFFDRDSFLIIRFLFRVLWPSLFLNFYSRLSLLYLFVFICGKTYLQKHPYKKLHVVDLNQSRCL